MALYLERLHHNNFYAPIIGTETSGRVGTLRAEALTYGVYVGPWTCFSHLSFTYLRYTGSGLSSASYDFDAKSVRNTAHNSLQILALLILLQL